MAYKGIAYFYTGKARRSSCAGITLIELLIALSIFSVITLSLYLTFSSGIRFSQRFHSAENIYRDIRTVVDTMSLDLENMVPYEQTIDYGSVHKVIVGPRTQKNVDIHIRLPAGLDKDAAGASLTGTDKDLSFIVPTTTGLKQISYYLSEPEELKIHQTLVNYFSADRGAVTNQTIGETRKKLLLIRESRPFPYLDLEDIKEGIEIEILSADVLKDGLKFSYAAHEGTSETSGIVWKDEWRERRFPLGVQMDVVFVAPGGHSQTVEIPKKFLIPLGLPPHFNPKVVMP